MGESVHLKHFNKYLINAFYPFPQKARFTLTIISLSKVTQRVMNRLKLGITLGNKKPNRGIRKQTEIGCVIDRMVRLKWQWAGHIARVSDDRWTSRTLGWCPCDSTQSQGRIRWTMSTDKLLTGFLKPKKDCNRKEKGKTRRERNVQSWCF